MVPKHSKHLKHYLASCQPFPSSAKQTKNFYSLLKVRSAKYYEKFCRSVLCVNCNSDTLFEVTRRNSHFCFFIPVLHLSLCDAVLIVFVGKRKIVLSRQDRNPNRGN